LTINPLNDYLAGIALDQLSNQAAVGGISFSTGANNGLMVTTIWPAPAAPRSAYS
jgi:secreted Zn-dependent insulinase-like peptidase